MGTPTADEIKGLIRAKLAPAYAEWRKCRSTAELEAHPLYRELRPIVEIVLNTVETGDYRGAPAAGKEGYRVVAWNIERGIRFEEQLEVFRHHPHISRADVLLLIETDDGMARSGNRNVAREFARALGMAYAFAPCYLSLVKGSGVEYHIEGENEIGLHGNAVLSRYPIRSTRLIRLRNGRDKMAGREKRLGAQAALAAEIELPQGRITAVAVHLDAQSSQRHRVSQMRDILDHLPPDGPAVLGGDWNTSTYNSSHAFYAICGFWLRVLMGTDYVIPNHYLRPESFFERRLFRLLESRGFDYRSANVMGERTTWYDMDEEGPHQNLLEWVPHWCFPFIHWALRNHDNKCPFKLDWFAVRGLKALHPAVWHDVREGRAIALSDHDAISVDVRLE
jgi:endonuclease/exonuclease/phosphatase family metal-dependent hydrolase